MTIAGKQITVVLRGGGPWGFRLGGGSEFGCPLEIAKIRKNSKAERAGLQEGDIVTYLDNQSVSKKSHVDATKIAEAAGFTLAMQIWRGPAPNIRFKPSESAPTLNAPLDESGRIGLSTATVVRELGAPSSTTPVSGSRAAGSKSSASQERKSLRPRSRSLNSRFSWPLFDATMLGSGPLASPSSTTQTREPIVVRIEPMEIPKPKPEPPSFKVPKAAANTQPNTWQPSSIRIIRKSPTPVLLNDIHPGEKRCSSPGISQPIDYNSVYWDYIPPQPSHIPGLFNPVIFDGSQGDFGGNPLIRSSKKMYSDSTFFDTPDYHYPTIQEQMALCKRLALNLESIDNFKSKGGKLFQRLKHKAAEHTIVGQGCRRPSFSEEQNTARVHHGFGRVQHYPEPIKSNLNNEELERIQHNQDALCKHDLLPPVAAFDITSALEHSRGRGKEIFAERKLRSDKYIVDETNVGRSEHDNVLQFQLQYMDKLQHKDRRYRISPWDAAWVGNMEKAFAYFDEFAANSCDIQPLDLATHTLPISNKKATFGVKYRPFERVSLSKKYVEVPKNAAALEKATTEPPTRLAQMIARSKENMAEYDACINKPSFLCNPAGKSVSMMDLSCINQDAHQGPWLRPKDFLPNPIYVSMDCLATSPRAEQPELTEQAPVRLMRPKEYLCLKPSTSSKVFYSAWTDQDSKGGNPLPAHTSAF